MATEQEGQAHGAPAPMGSSEPAAPVVLGRHDSSEVEAAWLHTLADHGDAGSDMTFKPAGGPGEPEAGHADATLTFKPTRRRQRQTGASPTTGAAASGVGDSAAPHTISSPHPERTTLRSVDSNVGLDASGHPLADGPGYHLLERIGEGGMGIVWRGFQGSLLRHVAIKQTRRSGADESFLAEAMVTAYLDHPNIVPVHALGEDADGSLFMSMKLVNGLSWKDLMHPETEAHRARASEFGQVGHLRILLAVCNAVAYAHSRDVLHRDLKPANVMVGSYGEIVLMDWGIALDISDPPQDPRRTRHRSFVDYVAGTPAYMAPEMAIGNGPTQGPWTDVYLLGAILHEILTGKPPHRGHNVMATVIAASRGDPPKLGEDVPDDLRDLCCAAMAREPADRPSSVLEVRDRLERHLSNRESIVISERAEAELETLQSGRLSVDREARHAAFAKVVARFEQALELFEGNVAATRGVYTARLAYGREALASGDLGVAAAQIAALPASDAATRKLSEQIAAAQAARVKAARQGRHLRIALAAAAATIALGLVLGMVMVNAARGRAADERDEAHQARAQERRARHLSEAARAAAEKAHHRSRTLLAEALVGQADAMTLGGRYGDAATLLQRADQRLRDLGEAPMVADLGLWLLLRHATPPLWRQSGHGAALRGVQVSADGRLVLSGSWESHLKLWHGPTGRLLHTLKGHVDRIRVSALSDDGARAMSGSADRQARLWHTASGTVERPLVGHTAELIAADFAAAGQRLLTSGLDNRLILWDATQGTVLRQFEHVALLLGASISADGNSIFALDSSVFRTWSVASGEVEREIRYEAPDGFTPWRGLFPPAGGHALVLLHGGEGVDRVEVWDAVIGRPLRVLNSGLDNIGAVALEQRGRWAASGGQGVSLWQMSDSSQRTHFVGTSREIHGIGLSDDARHLVAGDDQGHLALWSRLPQRALRSIPLEAKPQMLFFVAGGHLLLVKGTGHASHYRYYDVASGAELATIEAALPSGRRIAVADDGRLVVLRRGEAGLQLEVLGPAGKRSLGTIKLTSPRVGPPNDTLAQMPATTEQLADPPRGVHLVDGDQVALVVGAHGSLSRYRLADGALLGHMVPAAGQALPGASHSVVAPNGAALLVGDADHQLLWDLRAGRSRRIDQPDARDSAMSQDGEVLALATGATVTLWQVADAVRDARYVAPSLGEERAAISRIAFLAGTGMLAVAAEDRTVALWHAPTGRLLRVLGEDAAAWPAPIAASPRSDLLVTPGLDAHLLLWDFEHARHFESLRRRLAVTMQTLARHPDDRDALQRLGSWYALRGQWGWAAELLERARELGAKVSDLELYRAHRHSGHAAPAQAALQRAHEAGEVPAFYVELLGRWADKQSPAVVP